MPSINNHLVVVSHDEMHNFIKERTPKGFKDKTLRLNTVLTRHHKESITDAEILNYFLIKEQGFKGIVKINLTDKQNFEIIFATEVDAQNFINALHIYLKTSETSTARVISVTEQLKNAEQKFTQQMMLKKLGLTHRSSITGKEILESYANNKQWFANRSHRERITKILPNIGKSITNRQIATLIRDSFEHGETINPNGTLALILRYLDPVLPESDKLKIGYLALLQATNKLGVQNENLRSKPPLELAEDLINAYIVPTSFFHRHFTNRHHAQLLKDLCLHECKNVLECYGRILGEVENKDIDPQGTLAMLINALKYLTTAPTHEVQMDEIPQATSLNNPN